MPQLEQIVETMQDGSNHPDFRLWLSSKPQLKFPITLLQTSLKIAFEQPKVSTSIKNDLHNY